MSEEEAADLRRKKRERMRAYRERRKEIEYAEFVFRTLGIEVALEYPKVLRQDDMIYFY